MQWRVIGSERQTGKDVNRTTDAPDRQTVESWAQAMGIFWSDIILDVPYASGDEKSSKPNKPVDREAPPAKAMEGEKVYLSQQGVIVTSRRVVIGGTSYVLANITSVELAIVEESRTFPALLLIVGILGMLMIAVEAWFCALPGVILFLVGIVCMVGASKDDYAIKIGSASGEKMELQRHDKNSIQKVVDAVNAAIVERL